MRPAFVSALIPRHLRLDPLPRRPSRGGTCSADAAVGAGSPCRLSSVQLPVNLPPGQGAEPGQRTWGGSTGSRLQAPTVAVLPRGRPGAERNLQPRQRTPCSGFWFGLLDQPPFPRPPGFPTCKSATQSAYKYRTGFSPERDCPDDRAVGPPCALSPSAESPSPALASGPPGARPSDRPDTQSSLSWRWEKSGGAGLPHKRAAAT